MCTKRSLLAENSASKSEKYRILSTWQKVVIWICFLSPSLNRLHLRCFVAYICNRHGKLSDHRKISWMPWFKFYRCNVSCRICPFFWSALNCDNVIKIHYLRFISKTSNTSWWQCRNSLAWWYFFHFWVCKKIMRLKKLCLKQKSQMICNQLQI